MSAIVYLIDLGCIALCLGHFIVCPSVFGFVCLAICLAATACALLCDCEQCPDDVDL